MPPPSEEGSGSGFSEALLDESLSSVFSAMRDSLRGAPPPSSVQRMWAEAEAASADVEGDDHLEVRRARARGCGRVGAQ
eukprot:5685895-Prymnesium_polylepis.1